MKHHYSSRWSRYFLVGLLVTGMAVDDAAARRLFRQRACLKCPTACVDVCPPVCPATSFDNPGVVPCDWLDGTIVADSPCAAAETSIEATSCQECAAETQPDIVSEPIFVPESIVEELTAPPVVSVEPSQPEVEHAPTEAAPSPIEPASQHVVLPPAPVAVPEVSEAEAPSPLVPQTVTPAIVEQPATEVVGDRYSNNEDLFGPSEPEDSTTPEPADEPATSTNETDNLFGELAATSEEEEESSEAPLPEPTQVEPTAEDPALQPELDEDDLFDPAESSEIEEAIEQPQIPKIPEESAPIEPAPTDLKKNYDPFADDSTDFKKLTSTLNEAGGLQSKTERTWTDNSAAFECSARLVRVTTKNVVLLKSTGAKLVVPFSRLADNDLQFVHQQITTLRIVRAREAAAAKLAVAWAR